MPFLQMWRKLMRIPGVTARQAQGFINEALYAIYDDQLWSWQIQTTGWYAPGLLVGNAANNTSPGTITATLGSNLITGDATASAAWSAVTYPFFTSYQIRLPDYNLYSIWNVDATNPNAVVLTLDRNWMEPGGTGLGYMAYQAYFPLPVPDLKRFEVVRDLTNNRDMNYWDFTQQSLALEDPQRTVYQNPTRVVPYQNDGNPNSPTYGNMLYELWPHPLAPLPYAVNFLRQGPLLVNATDKPPYPLTEDAVVWRAFEFAYQFKEESKGDSLARGSGANWMLLMKSAEDQYERRIKAIRQTDRNLVDLYRTKLNRNSGASGPYYNATTGALSIGDFSS